MRRIVPATALVMAGLLLAAGCTDDDAATGAAGSGGTTVTIELTDDGCRPSPDSVPAGQVTFEVSNTSADSVTEAELMKGDTIIGEKENLTPGLSGSFTLRLEAGAYVVACPNAKTEKWDFTVTGSAAAASQDPAVAAALQTAVAGYKQYVIDEVAKLIPATKRFTDAVRAGKLDEAKRQYPLARYYYEEVEPVAESFGDLDPAIDARIDDVPDPAQWTGFHRLEKALWQDRTVAGMKPVADRLDADVAKLRDLVASATYQPAQLANGATELLNEVASSKITGEEDRYSHTDLYDFEANLAGAKKAFDLLAPALRRIDPTLAETVSQGFAEVSSALAGYKSGVAFVDYSNVAAAQRRVLTQKVDALAEPLSQVAAKVSA